LFRFLLLFRANFLYAHLADLLSAHRRCGDGIAAVCEDSNSCLSTAVAAGVRKSASGTAESIDGHHWRSRSARTARTGATERVIGGRRSRRARSSSSVGRSTLANLAEQLL
jgi:hypothetical protein